MVCWPDPRRRQSLTPSTPSTLGHLNTGLGLTTGSLICHRNSWKMIRRESLMMAWFHFWNVIHSRCSALSSSIWPLYSTTEGTYTFSDGTSFTLTGGTIGTSDATWSTGFTAWKDGQPKDDADKQEKQDCVKVLLAFNDVSILFQILYSYSNTNLPWQQWLSTKYLNTWPGSTETGICILRGILCLRNAWLI